MERLSDNSYLISFDSPTLGYGTVRLDNSEYSGILPGVTVILGENGSGKSTLATVLEKGRYGFNNRLGFKNPEAKVKLLAFSDIHSLSCMEVEYMAQRMEATMNEYVPTVSKILGKKIENPLWEKYCDALSLKDVADKKINYLSSGELRKLIIINALLASPDILILDNPYIGLDAASREEFDSAMKSLSNQGTSVILVLCDAKDIPAYTDSVILMENCHIHAPLTDKDKIEALREKTEAEQFDENELPPAPASSPLPHSVAFAIRGGHVKYGDREILKNIDWEIKKGECWALTGPNGSGKSLLLSMVCADNPQGYANDITLFDRKRGSGESIWEIKDNIGYVSPEMQLFFKSTSPVREIVMQGLRLSLERYKPATAEELELTDRWLDLLGISHLSSRLFNQLSAGEQRLVLVARAMIKQPQLLVLDEPLHGLDPANKKRVKEITNAMMRKNGTSLIFVTHYESEIPDCVSATFHLQRR